MDFNIFLEKCPQNCNKIQEKIFNKSDIITTYIEKRNQVCILVTGEADLIRYDFNGNKTIIKHLSEHDIFGETFYPAKTNNELFVIARKKCHVIFFTYDIILEKCKSNCKFHTELRQNITELILREIIEQNTRIEVLTQKTIRDKLLSYFNILSAQGLRRSFTIPFTITDLADFLSVDRSAMTRELSNLKKEGFIEQTGNVIKLLMN
jgi:CRP-like cAMP-binding protein